MICVAFPQEAASTPADVKLLYQKVDDLIQKNVTTVTAPQTSSDDNNAGAISFLLLVIKTLTEVQRNFIDPLVLVRLLQRLQRDMGSSTGSHIRQVCWIFPSYVAIFFIYLFILNL
jgi:transformation/transcription domain-associated protein